MKTCECILPLILKLRATWRWRVTS